MGSTTLTRAGSPPNDDESAPGCWMSLSSTIALADGFVGSPACNDRSSTDDGSVGQPSPLLIFVTLDDKIEGGPA